MGKGKKACFCPYCMNEIAKKDIKFYFELGRIFDYDPKDPFISLYRLIFRSHGSVEGKYYRYWKSNFDCETCSEGVVFDPMGLRGRVSSKTGEGVYSVGNLCIDLNGVPTISSKNGGISESASAILCPHCENVLPLEYFDENIDHINILIAGAASVGKTVFMMSMLQNNCYYLVGDSQHLKINHELRGCCEQIENFYKDLELFQNYGILPGKTAGPVPPLFLRAKWTLPERGERDQIICLIDTKGDRWENDLIRTEIAPFVRSCSGIIYLVEPNQGMYRKAAANKNGEVLFACYEEDETVSPDGFLNTDSRTGLLATPGTAGNIYNQYFSDIGEKETSEMKCAFVLAKLDRYISDDNPYIDDDDKSRIPYWNVLANPSGYKEYTPYDHEEVPYRHIAAYRLFREYFPVMPVAGQSTFKKAQWFGVSALDGNASYYYENELYNIIPENIVKSLIERNGGDTGILVADRRTRTNPLNIHEPLLWILLQSIEEKQEEMSKLIV